MMTKLGVRVGIDMVGIARMQRMLEADTGFLTIGFTDREQAECNGDPARLATRWAAKEAVMKALGRGIGDISPLDIEVASDSFGEPSLNVIGSAGNRASEMGISAWSVTLCHESDMAIAAVVAVTGGKNDLR